MDYQEKIQNAGSLDELFELWRNKAPESFDHTYGKKNIHVDIDHANKYFIPDGIVDPDVWNSEEKKRILFILKEAYGTDWGNRTLATWLHSDHPYKSIWRRVAKWVNGIQNTDEHQIPRYREAISDKEHADALDQIAVINLKKSDGDTGSDYAEIDAYAKGRQIGNLKGIFSY